ncbi:MAG: aminotransferase class V-fold PLP-dependent enzyme [Gilvibacter sp.]
MQEELAVFARIVDRLLTAEQEQPVLSPLPADSIEEQLHLSVEQEGLAPQDFEKLLTKLVLSTPRTATRLFFNQLFGGRQSKAVLGDLLAVLLNNSMYTYKVAGPQVGVEKAIVNEVVSMIGYPETANGTIASGGSMSNLIAMLMARDKADPDARYKGLTKKLVAYTSEASHYSIAKNAAFIGLGTHQVRKIKTNDLGELMPAQLAAQIQEDIADGLTPFFVNATAGTTVLGAFDPIRAIHKVTQPHAIWLHVDGAYCGSVIFSEKYKHLADGLELTDSFNFNAHKMLGTPLTCSIIVVKDKLHLYDSLSMEASYLYQTHEDDFNLGKTSLQCGRRNDALKFWTLWKAIGTKGLEKLVDKQFELATVARDYVKNHPDYTLYSYDNSISVCFNYKDIPADDLCTALYEAGKVMVGFGSFNEQTFVRLVTINPNNNKEDILNFFSAIESNEALY